MRIWIYLIICVLFWKYALITFLGVCAVEVLGTMVGVFKDSC